MSFCARPVSLSSVLWLVHVVVSGRVSFLGFLRTDLRERDREGRVMGTLRCLVPRSPASALHCLLPLPACCWEPALVGDFSALLCSCLGILASSSLLCGPLLPCGQSSCGGHLCRSQKLPLCAVPSLLWSWDWVPAPFFPGASPH